MKWSAPLIALVCLNIAHGDELAPLVKSIGACKHLSVGRSVREDDEEALGKGFRYETSDSKTIARVLTYLESLPARDSWNRFGGQQPIMDAAGLMSLQFQRTDGRTVKMLVMEPRDLVFENNQLFELQVKDLAEFYRIIGKQDVVRLAAYAGIPLEIYRYDGTEDYHARQRKVRDVVPVQRQPLFDNVPFFRLREGDRLVKAREVGGAGSGPVKAGKKPIDLRYFLETSGKYFQLQAEGKDGKVLLVKTPGAASACILFDWEVTLENARAIRAMLPPTWSGSLSREQYDAIIRATRAEFPKLITKETVLEPYLHGEQVGVFDGLVSGIPGLASYAAFEGIVFDPLRSEICQYEIRIGPEQFFVRTKTLLQGPRHERAIEFRKMVQGIIQPKKRQRRPMKETRESVQRPAGPGPV